jgi:hypothetical protein
MSELSQHEILATQLQNILSAKPLTEISADEAIEFSTKLNDLLDLYKTSSIFERLTYAQTQILQDASINLIEQFIENKTFPTKKTATGTTYPSKKFNELNPLALLKLVRFAILGSRRDEINRRDRERLIRDSEEIVAPLPMSTVVQDFASMLEGAFGKEIDISFVKTLLNGLNPKSPIDTNSTIVMVVLLKAIAERTNRDVCLFAELLSNINQWIANRNLSAPGKLLKPLSRFQVKRALLNDIFPRLLAVGYEFTIDRSRIRYLG